MPKPFCPGYGAEPYKTLVEDAPGAEVFPAKDFRVEWGPIFHRGRLDGSARVLIIGQDPAQHEAILRRILVGTAGKRVQGFLAHLGITTSYVLINAFLYSVYGQHGGNKHKNNPEIAAYRNRWIRAILDHQPIEAVVAFGGLANLAWEAWLASPEAAGRAELPFRHVMHPTAPDSAGGTAAVKKAAMKAMLASYNVAIEALLPSIAHPDAAALTPYVDALRPEDLPAIPQVDVPAGFPAWVTTTNTWATRTGEDAAEKRRTIKVVVPAAEVP